MIEIIQGFESLIVRSSLYVARLDKKKAGTLRALSFGGIDTGLSREGCEYWINNKDHFEQEFGALIDLHIIASAPDLLLLGVKASIVSPQNKVEGGQCDVEWTFAEDSITSKSRIRSVLPCFCYDKYVCFKPDVFDEFKPGASGFEEIRHPSDGETWWEFLRTNLGGMAVRNDRMTLDVFFDEKLSFAGIYTSKSMMEIKFQDLTARQGEWATMTIKGMING